MKSLHVTVAFLILSCLVSPTRAQVRGNQLIWLDMTISALYFGIIAVIGWWTSRRVAMIRSLGTFSAYALLLCLTAQANASETNLYLPVLQWEGYVRGDGNRGYWNVQKMVNYNENLASVYYRPLVNNAYQGVSWAIPMPLLTNVMDNCQPELSAAHSNGIKIIGYADTVQFSPTIFTQNGIASEPYYALSSLGATVPYGVYDGGNYLACITRPQWVEFQKAVVNYTASRGFDGLMFDLYPYASSLGYSCHCSDCSSSWSNRSSSVFGSPQSMPGSTLDFTRPVDRVYYQWRLDLLNTFMKAVETNVWASSPEFMLLQNANADFPDYVYCAINGGLKLPNSEISQLSLGSESSLYLYRMAEAASGNKLFAIMNSPSQWAPLFRYKCGLAESYAAGGNLMACSDSSVDAATGTFLGNIKSHESWYLGSVSGAKVGILYSWRDHVYLQLGGLTTSGVMGWSQNAARRAAAILAHRGIPFDYVIVEKGLSLSALNKYDVIIAPNLAWLDDSDADGLNSYVQQGGRLLSIGVLGSRKLNGYNLETRTTNSLSAMTGLSTGSGYWETMVSSGKVAYVPAAISGGSESTLGVTADFNSGSGYVGLNNQIALSAAHNAIVESTVRMAGDAQVIHVVRLGDPSVLAQKWVDFYYSLPAGVKMVRVDAFSPDGATADLGMTWDLDTPGKLHVNLAKVESYAVVKVTPVTTPMDVENLSASILTTTSAGLNVRLGTAETNTDLYAFWGPADGANNPVAWSNSAYVGSWTNVAMTNIAFPVSGLLPNTPYYFTFCASNVSDQVWATNVLSFTITLTPPAIDNGIGATSVQPGIVSLHGTLTAFPAADVRIYWGTSDGGTNTTGWGQEILLTNVLQGAFSSTVSNLLYGVQYYYRCFASNSLGTAWATATTSFTSLSPSSAGWTPTNMPGLALWLDASDSNTVQLSGSSVNQWNDKSGKGKNVAKAPNAPTYMTSGLNGSNVVRFASASSQSMLGSVVFSNGTSCSVLCVLKYNDTSSALQSIYSDEDSLNGGPSIYLQANSGAVRIFGGTYVDAGNYTNGQVEINVLSRNVSNGNLWRDGVQALTNAAIGASANNRGFLLGRLVNGLYGSFDLAELIALDGEVSASDRQKTEGYLAWKWGLQSKLPADHPYKSAATGDGVMSTVLSNAPATVVGTTNATLNATLSCSGAVYAVFAHWNTVNGGANAALWTNSAYVGTWTNAAATNIAFTVTGLSPGASYYFTFCGSNAVDQIWAPNVSSFTATSTTPVVDNGGGATSVQPGFASLHGTLTASSIADVRIYWGTSDGGTNATGWGQEILLTNVVLGAFSSTVSNLLYGVQYYYRCFASNSLGTAWAPATTNFMSLSPSGAGWTPTNVPGLALWVDASDANTVQLSGSSVTNWLDKSGKGKNLAKWATAPTYVTSGLNGSNVVRFALANSQSMSGGVVFADGTSCSVLCVLKYSDALSASQSIYANENTGYGTPSIYLQANSGTVRVYGGAYVSEGTYTNEQVEINVLSRNASNGNLWRDGAQALTNAALGGSTSNRGFLLGSLVSSLYGSFDLAELIALDGEVSAGDRQKTEGYLAWKWGLQSKLPADHPYKSAAPGSDTPPIAAFNATPTNGYVPLRTVFTDNSTGTITNRYWDFGDGNTLDTMSQVSVTNLYTNAGVYAVSLTVSGPGGASTNTQAGLIGVMPVPTPSFVGTNAFLVNASDGSFSFNVSCTNGLLYRLVYKDSLTATGSSWLAVTPPFPNGWTNGGNGSVTLQDTNTVGVPQRFYRIDSKSVSETP